MTDQDRPKPLPSAFGALEVGTRQYREHVENINRAFTNDETQAFRDRVMIETALKLVESGRMSNRVGGETKAIANFAANLAARLVEHRNND